MGFRALRSRVDLDSNSKDIIMKIQTMIIIVRVWVLGIGNLGLGVWV